MEPVPRAPIGVNGPTIFTGAGALARIDRTLPYGPGGGLLNGLHCSIPQGGPSCADDRND